MEKENFIENLNWRYATKKFDPNRKLNPETVATVLDSIQLSASSYGLQPYEVFVIEDMETREKLKEVSWNQPQITDCLSPAGIRQLTPALMKATSILTWKTSAA